MHTETTLAKNIRIVDDKANYDAACKRLLSEKIILAWIMKSCLEEYRDCAINEIAETYIEEKPQVAEVATTPDETNTVSIIHGMSSEDTTVTEGTVTYDIRFAATAPVSGEMIRLIINVEAQNDFYPGYPLIKRGIYYCSRMVSSQYGTEFVGSHYENIKKVYSIWICMNPPKNRENSITRYSITEENLVGNVKESKANYDLMTAIMICLGSAGEKYDTGVLKLLDVLLSTETGPVEKCQILSQDFQIEMTQTLESEVSLMCNLSKGVEEKGIKKGIEQGIEQGIERGIEQGIEQGIERGIEQGIHSMVSVLKDLGIPVETILMQLQEKFQLTIEEAKSYLNK